MFILMRKHLNLVPAVYHLWFGATKSVTTSSTGFVGHFSLYVNEEKKKEVLKPFFTERGNSFFHKLFFI